MNIILIGFASSGKSATADAIHAETGRSHFDLDRVVESRHERKSGRRAGCREIFKDAGSDGFSERENDALRSLSNLRNAILSTGGRTPMCEENRALLKSMGKIIYLKCGVDTVLKRMDKKGRPASMGKSSEEIAAEWERRVPIYTDLADIIIENDTQSPEETARIILEKLQGI
jgi:shikimate kinase